MYRNSYIITYNLCRLTITVNFLKYISEYVYVISCHFHYTTDFCIKGKETCHEANTFGVLIILDCEKYSAKKPGFRVST